jgi:tetratricopeptide (TPR) repeat protein
MRIALLVILAGAPAAADAPSLLAEPGLDVARRHYEAGLAAYDAGNYSDALAEFAAARETHPSPELEFNVGRCHERLGHFTEAADAYERYLAARPDSKDAVDLRALVSVLRARAHAPQPAPAPAARPVAAVIGAVVAVALAAVGAAAYATAVADYDAERDACGGRCDPATLGSFRASVEAREAVAVVGLGLALAVAAVDVVLWARRRGARGDRPSALLAPSHASARVGF